MDYFFFDDDNSPGKKIKEKKDINEKALLRVEVVEIAIKNCLDIIFESRDGSLNF